MKKVTRKKTLLITLIFSLFYQNPSVAMASFIVNISPCHIGNLAHLKMIQTSSNSSAKIQTKSKSGKMGSYLAAQKYHTKRIKTLLKCSADSESAHGDEITALHQSVLKGDLDFVNVLMKAVHCGHIQTLKILLDLIISNSNTASATTNNHELVRVLTRALLDAADMGHTEVVDIFLDSGYVSVDAVDACGNTALIKAAFWGDLDTVKTLLGRKANIEAQDAEGCTALMAAAVRGGPEIEHLLLEYGANLEAKDKEGNTALILAAKYSHKAENVTDLLNRRANIEAVNEDGCTPLHEAAISGRVEIVQALLEGGASIDVKTKTGKTALCLAARKGHKDCIKLLKEYD